MTVSPRLDTLTDVPGLAVGHFTNREAATGCTVILFRDGAVVGVDVRGAAPGTRETDLLRPGNLVERAQAVLLTGGSAFGLAAADGVMRFLEERGLGHPTASGVVPIVPAAVIYDLGIGRSDVRPDAASGYSACVAASRDPVEQGCVGAGTGATIGKVLGPAFATKSGLGSAAEQLPDGGIVAALAVVNAGGNVIDPLTAAVVAGVRDPRGGFQDAEAVILAGQAARRLAGTNTTLVLVAINARLDGARAARLAMVAHDGLARSLRPVHTLFDGDTVFAAATGGPEAPVADFNVLAIGAVRATERAVARAARFATGLGGIPAAVDWPAVPRAAGPSENG